MQPGPETGLGRIACGAELVHITDIADPGEAGAGDPDAYAPWNSAAFEPTLSSPS
jgi:hypothetical protein